MVAWQQLFFLGRGPCRDLSPAHLLVCVYCCDISGRGQLQQSDMRSLCASRRLGNLLMAAGDEKKKPSVIYSSSSARTDPSAQRTRAVSPTKPQPPDVNGTEKRYLSLAFSSFFLIFSFVRPDCGHQSCEKLRLPETHLRDEFFFFSHCRKDLTSKIVPETQPVSPPISGVKLMTTMPGT